ncbi:facilitated trehalose transporter Tret1-like isoform X2 [Sitophilus oryzae]|uniref:Facilitated trehalose transporter Tret1-like isoform X2 n=1 Tax=Sitophilus oryzae TaxID=7048 RepID=A0A6J2YS59_SITOR|nr:facilitated trehalose transporter Tret1-like isoform X2 [Sitophilus oryzae]
MLESEEEPCLMLIVFETRFFSMFQLLQISHNEASWLAVAIFPGIVVGAVVAKCFAKSCGPRKLILSTALPMLVSWLLIGFSGDKISYFVGRFLGGIGSGISFSTVPMYIGEISEPQIRGFLSSLCPVFVVFGMLFINVLCRLFSISISALIASSIPLINFVTFFWMPESPIWLLSKEESKKAKENLIVLRGQDNGLKEFERLSALNLQSTEEKTEFLQFFKAKENKKALLIALGLRSVQQLCGSTALTFYCQTIFRENDKILSPGSATIIFFCLQAVFSVFSSFIVDIFGRRPLFLVSLSCTTLTLLVLALYTFIKSYTSIDLENISILAPVTLLINVIFLSLGVRNIPLLVMSEIFNPKFKPLALSIATIYYAFLAIIITQFFRITKDAIDLSFPLFCFTGFSLVSLVLYYFFVPETNNKTLEDIQKTLQT